MLKLKAWGSAARLRTLPLSVSGILVGTSLASLEGFENGYIFLFAILTTLGLQITSNFANDYGDGVKGTDNSSRIGPKRALQSGALSKNELKKGILVSVVITTFLIGILLYLAFQNYRQYMILFGVLGALSIWAAIRYTVGKKAYGYRGFGDVFVFCFFGLVSVVGSMFLFTKYITLDAFLPGVAIGLLSTAVLNLNNLRDYHSDKEAKKNTLVVYLGLKNGKRYHYGLMAISFLCMFFFLMNQQLQWQQVICMISFVPLLLHVIKVYHIKDPVLFDPELKKVALSTFLLAILFYFGFNIFS
ncbi:MAG: 1,4-dihydroxy-2-naphthoate octaprenyltransferase [Eudoraea sp.]|nr:1,4-dihydroxy-2-naphthoate octaprenyltransferase [Eudoraea sp.]